jgi:hypothetical protein
MEAQDLFALDGLTDLGARTGANMRPTLLRVLTDLYVHRCSHTAAEERHYTELALRLLEVVDQPTRIAVARRSYARIHCFSPLLPPQKRRPLRKASAAAATVNLRPALAASMRARQESLTTCSSRQARMSGASFCSISTL